MYGTLYWSYIKLNLCYIKRGQSHFTFKLSLNPLPPPIKTNLHQESYTLRAGGLNGGERVFALRPQGHTPLAVAALCKCLLNHSLPTWEHLCETQCLLLCYFNVCCCYNLKSSLYPIYNPVTRSPQHSLSGGAVKHSGKLGTLLQNFRRARSWLRRPNDHRDALY